jgi:hypothetical protein
LAVLVATIFVATVLAVVIVARCGKPLCSLRKHCSEACAINGIGRKKAAPDNSARMVVARQRLIYYRRRRADHTDQSDQPARTTSQSFFNRREVVGFQAERPQGIQVPPKSRESHLPEMLRRSTDVPSRIEFRCGLLVAVKYILATAEQRRCLRRRVKDWYQLERASNLNPYGMGCQLRLHSCGDWVSSIFGGFSCNRLAARHNS